MKGLAEKTAAPTKIEMVFQLSSFRKRGLMMMRLRLSFSL